VAAGRIIFGAVGDRTRLEYTVIGDAANLSAKLVKHNKALHSEALTTAETYALALAQGYSPPQPRKTVAQARWPAWPSPSTSSSSPEGPRCRSPERDRAMTGS
jgi:class 3 adenylate cyclase